MTMSQPIEPVILDPAMIDQMATLERLGKTGITARLANLYLDNSAARTGDQDALRRAFHSLKSTSATLGANAFAARCSEHETAARHGTLRLEGPLLDELAGMYAAVRTAVAALAGRGG
jgi:chemotaxis protein histidine kinase CheA